MSEHIPSSKNESTDEIDLGQLLQFIKKGFNNLGNQFLRMFLFLKKHGLILIGLVLLGLAISYGLNQIINKKLKMEVIVRPNFDSKDFLYDTVDELNANIKAENENFFASIGIELKELDGFEIELVPIESSEKDNEEMIHNQMRYLEALSNFKDQSYVADIIKAELADQSVVDHKISFIYVNELTGPTISRKLLDLINENEYLEGLREISNKNAKNRIANNTKLISQVDMIIDNYSKSLNTKGSRPENGMVYMEKENPLNVTSLLSLKNGLAQDIEKKNLELKTQSKVISIINQGNTQVVKESFYKNRMIMIPMLLVLGFFVTLFLKYLNKKAKEIQ